MTSVSTTTFVPGDYSMTRRRFTILSLALAHGLVVDPLPDDFLLRAHLAHQLIDALGELPNRLDGFRAASGARLHPLAQARHGALQVIKHDLQLPGRRVGDDATLCRREIGNSGEPLFELVVEAIVGMAGLKLEEAQHKRACQAEE